MKEKVIVRDSAQELIDAGMRVKDPEEVIAARDITCFNGNNTTERKLWFRRDKGTATDLLNIMMQEVTINVEESDTEEKIIERVYQTIKEWKELVKSEKITVDI